MSISPELTIIPGYLETTGNIVTGIALFTDQIFGDSAITDIQIENTLIIRNTGPQSGNITFDGAIIIDGDSNFASGIAIGKNTRAFAEYSIAIGSSETHVVNAATGGIAIGQNANVFGGIEAISIGPHTLATGNRSISIGTLTNATGAYTVVIGNVASASAADAIAIGRSAQASGSNAVALGLISVASGGNGVAIGPAANATNTNAIAIGGSSTASNSGGVALGQGSGSTGAQSIAIGQASTASNDQSIAIGTNSTSSAAGTVAIGDSTIASATKAIAISSYYAVASGVYSIAIGHGSASFATDGIGIGRSAFGLGSHCIAIGRDCGGDATTGTDNIAIGQLALTSMNNVSAAFNVAVGYHAGFAVQTGHRNTFVGRNAGSLVVSGSYNVCVGSDSNTFASNTIRNVAIGNAVSGNASVAIGWQSSASPAYGIAVGRAATALGSHCIAIGNDTGGDGPTGSDNIAIGYFALTQMNSINADYNIAIGYRSGATIQEGTKNTCFGTDAGQSITSGSYNVFVGSGANGFATNTTNSVAIGVNAIAGNSAVAVNNSSASGLRAVAIGHYSTASGENAVSIGYNAGPDIGTGLHNIAIGSRALLDLTSSTSNMNVAMGTHAMRYFTSGTHLQNVAIGFFSMAGTPGGKTSDTQYNVCIGSRTGYLINGGDNNAFIGTNAGDTLTTGTTNVCVGVNTDVSAATIQNGVAIGNNAKSFTGSVGMGQSARAYGSNSVSIGYATLVSGTSAVAMGPASTVSGLYSIAIGRFAYSNTSYGVAIGSVGVQVNATRVSGSGGGGIAIGRSTKVTSQEGIAIGVLAITAYSSHCIAIGEQATATGPAGIALGRISSANGAYGIAIGRSSSASASKSVAIGYMASNSVANTLVLAPNGTEAMRLLDSATGNFTFRTVASTVTESPAGFFVPTAAQLVGGYISVAPPQNSASVVTQWIRESAVFNTTTDDGFWNHDIAVDNYGNIYVAYHTSGTVSGGTNLGNQEIVIFKLDANGTHLWNRQVATLNTIGSEYTPSIEVDDSRNIYLVYGTIGTISGGTKAGAAPDTDVVIAKLDTNGTVLWTRQQTVYSTASDDWFARTAVNKSTGDLYFAYSTSGTISGGTNIGNSDIVVFKVDTNGNFVWSKQSSLFNTTTFDSVPGGGTQNQLGVGLDIDSSGNAYIAYYTMGTVSGGTNIGSNDIVVFKLDTNGNLLWNRQQSNFNTTGSDVSPDIVVDTSGNAFVVYMAGGTVSGGTTAGSSEIAVFKLDTNGTHQWNAQPQNLNTPGADVLPAIAIDSSGNLYITYRTTGTASGGTFLGAIDIVVARLNGSTGTLLSINQLATWNTTGSETAPHIAVNGNNAHILYRSTGTVSGGTNLGSSDMVVTKLGLDVGTGILAIGSGGGISGTTLSAYAQLAGNAYVGLTFRCFVKVTTNNLLAISGTTGVAVNGITPVGDLTALNTPRELLFINTGTNTWDMIVFS